MISHEAFPTTLFVCTDSYRCSSLYKYIKYPTLKHENPLGRAASFYGVDFERLGLMI